MKCRILGMILASILIFPTNLSGNTKSIEDKEITKDTVKVLAYNGNEGKGLKIFYIFYNGVSATFKFNGFELTSLGALYLLKLVNCLISYKLKI